MATEKNQEKGASASGFHFYNLYQCCPRKFYLRWVCRIAEKQVPFALLFGSAFHAGKAAWYESGEAKTALTALQNELVDSASSFENRMAYDKAVQRGEILLLRWISKWGVSDLKLFQVIAVEQHMDVTLGNGMNFTIKADTIVKSKKTKAIYVMETKTSGFSKQLTMDALRYGDQVTAYISGVEQVMGVRPAGVVGDVAYWNSIAKSEDNIDCCRTEVLKRSKRDSIEFLNSVGQVFAEIGQRVEYLKRGADPVQVFPRNTYYCLSYGKPCAYAGVCRTKLTPRTEVPIGFVRDVPKDLCSPVADDLAVR